MERLYGTEKIVLPEYVERRIRDGFVISKIELIEKYNRLKPLIESGGKLFQVNGLSCPDLLKVPYLDLNLSKFIASSPTLELCRVAREDLQELRDFICLHHCSIANEFEGTYGEILSQVPENILDSADYLQLVEWPRSTSDVARYTYKNHLSRVLAYKLK